MNSLQMEPILKFPFQRVIPRRHWGLRAFCTVVVPHCSTRTLYKKCLSLKKNKTTLFLFIFQLITFYCGHDLYSLRVKWQDYTPTSSRCLPILENTAQLDTSLWLYWDFLVYLPKFALSWVSKLYVRCAPYTQISCKWLFKETAFAV